MNSLMRSIAATERDLTEALTAGQAGPARITLPLNRLGLHRPAVVCRIDTAFAGQPAELARQLGDIGFVPGEQVVVLTRAWPGNDPMVVLVGHSRFALRSAEAACVQVQEIA
jgi:ferrous iron transport protein A